jgi:pimeloyl-ACP methyl ester carboxylesterase
LSPKPDPLFMLAGGPGQSSDAVVPLAGMLGGVRRDRDIVLVDPRGAGKSAPLQCAALTPRDPFDELVDTDFSRAAGRCLAEIKSTGTADVAQYTTPAFVADLDAVRDGLGYERINLWGGSYGTRVAQEYMRRYPQRVRSAVLDGVAPPDLRISLDVWPAREAALTRVIAACAEDAACKRAYPDLNATLAAIKKELAHESRISVIDPRTGAPRGVNLNFDMVVGALQALVYAPDLASLIPPLLARAETGDFAPLAAAALLATDRVSESMNLALHYAVTCAEDAPRISATEAKQALATLRAPGLAERNLAACDGWPRPALPPAFYSPLTSETPVLILSGGLDPVTPPANGKRVAETLPNSRHVIAAGYGHIVSPHACAPRLIEKFIDEAGFGTLPQSCLDYFATSQRPPLFASLLQPQ